MREDEGDVPFAKLNGLDRRVPAIAGGGADKDGADGREGFRDREGVVD